VRDYDRSDKLLGRPSKYRAAANAPVPLRKTLVSGVSLTVPMD
jgi:hypothetical protein